MILEDGAYPNDYNLGQRILTLMELDNLSRLWKHISTHETEKELFLHHLVHQCINIVSDTLHLHPDAQVQRDLSLINGLTRKFVAPIGIDGNNQAGRLIPTPRIRIFEGENSLDFELVFDRDSVESGLRDLYPEYITEVLAYFKLMSISLYYDDFFVKENGQYRFSDEVQQQINFFKARVMSVLGNDYRSYARTSVGNNDVEDHYLQLLRDYEDSLKRPLQGETISLN